MINKDFYPTPQGLVIKLLTGTHNCNTFLEPSAGKGDIVDLINKGNYNQKKIYCIEIEKDLQELLKSKNYNVIHDNFLTFNSFQEFDCIVANFPFSEGDKHLYKAIQMQKRNGGLLHCIVNAETIKNQFSQIRKEIQKELEDSENCEIEYIENAFIDAERTTGVEIALIKVRFKAKEKGISLLMENLKNEIQDNKNDEGIKEYDENPIARIVNLYKTEVRIGTKFIEEYKNLSKYFNKSKDSSESIFEIKINGREFSVNEYLKACRRKYWELFLNDKSIFQKYTTSVLKELRNKLDKMEEYDFTMFNIIELEKEVSKNVTGAIEKDIIAMFDQFSQEHSYNKEFGDNIHLYNGWKTNKAHKINEKVIIPVYVYDSIWNKLDTWKAINILKDIVKVFEYFKNENQTEEIEKITQTKPNFGEWIDFKYIKVRFYKKGTMHIYFKDKELLDMFNIYGSQKKGWLPPRYGRKYSEMSEEEKNTIKEFHGSEKEYEKIIDNNLYKKINSLSNNLLLLG